MDLITPDVLVSVFENLGIVDSTNLSRVCRLYFCLATEASRLPFLKTTLGAPSEIMASFKEHIPASPTTGFIFHTGDLASDDFMDTLTCDMPPGIELIGAGTSDLQATNAAGEMMCCNTDDTVAMTLGHFPEAQIKSFSLSVEECELVKQGADCAALDEILGMGAVVFVVLCSGQGTQYIEEVVSKLQENNKDAAIIGGLSYDQLIQVSNSHVNVVNDGIVGMAMAGNVPVTALVSRGTAPISRTYTVTAGEKEAGEDKVAAMTTGTTPWRIQTVDDGSTDKKSVINAAIDAQSQMHGRGMGFYAGLRSADEDFYVLHQVSQGSFTPDGGMICHLDSDLMSVTGWSMKFFQLDAQECQRDLRNSLQEVERQLAYEGKELLGGLMFSCSGRGPDDRFFGVPSLDATIYSQVFPEAPLLGFYAGGEIGPTAMAIDDDGDRSPRATGRIGIGSQTGSASVQGFTAVFGIFSVPVRTSGSPLLRQLMMDSGGNGVETALHGLLAARAPIAAREWKNLGNLQQNRGRHELATQFYTSGLKWDASSHILHSNRSAAHLSAKRYEEALADAKRCAEIKPSFAKGHFRQAKALEQLGRTEEACRALAQALEANCSEKERRTFEKLLAKLMARDDCQKLTRISAALGRDISLGGKNAVS